MDEVKWSPSSARSSHTHGSLHCMPYPECWHPSLTAGHALVLSSVASWVTINFVVATNRTGRLTIMEIVEHQSPEVGSIIAAFQCHL
jgi:hypothetical protein